jgi:hypothetical protein
VKTFLALRPLYKHSPRYNLLREDSEGYAKLITALGNQLGSLEGAGAQLRPPPGPGADAGDVADAANEEALVARVTGELYRELQVRRLGACRTTPHRTVLYRPSCTARSRGGRGGGGGGVGCPNPMAA